MADPGKKETDASVLNRLASRGEDALTRVMDELGKNPRVTDALAKAMDAKGKVDTTTRKTLGQVGLAAAGEIGEMRARLERLEKRLAAMEGTVESGGSTSRTTTTRKAVTTKSSGGTAKKSTTSSKSSSAKSGTKKSGGGASSSSKT